MTQTVLEEIVSRRRQTLAQFNWPTDVPAQSQRSMYESLQKSSHGIIFECKARSPSRGTLSEDYRPGDIARSYSHFAAGISVLTEPDYFSGDYSHLLAVRDAVDTPLLCKDFVVDLEQVSHARRHGADCILLMLSVIDDQFWQQAFDKATALGLDVLTEVHNEQELQRAVNLNAPIIGINNRDLHTLKTDLDVTRKLAPMIPAGHLVISESGISNHQDLVSLAPLVHGFLIGTSMMQSANTDQALRRLLYSEVKVCGLTNEKDARLAYECGACWGGLIFTSRSKRHVTAADVSSWVTQIPLPMVGVFMDQSIEEITAVVNQLSLAAVQLHGEETAAFARDLRAQLPEGVQIWKAISASADNEDYPDPAQLPDLISDWRKEGIDKILVDSPKEVSSHSINLADLMDQQDLLLAGGLGPDSALVAEKARLAGLDLCSGLEQSPGIKESNKIKQLFNKLKVNTRYD